ncbi:phenoloxidase-activating factor 3-like isoform X2 [Macrobrachium rosenbergii]|uniref:phenoloxidase-activating factor 3-like isoform X2 n=2 Tax=Macrobrachium rosenbergii TaxID=79674 RepID=UPI0034D6BC8A
MFASSSTSLNLLGILILTLKVTNTRAHLGSCEDHSTECSKWESWGFCDTNLKFMAQNCPVSCKICLDPGCFNRSPFCDSWALEGSCTLYDFVQMLCPHSCNLCQIPGEFLSNNTRSIARPDFGCGRPLRERRRGFERAKRQSTSAADFLLPVQSRSKRHTVHPFDHHHDDHHHDVSHDHQTRALLRKSPINFGKDHCSPVLIHQRFLLVAAHCALDPDRPIRRIRVGNLRPVDYEVSQVIIHPNYKLNSYERYNDIALLQTKEAIQFSEEAYPSCLSDQRPPAGSIVTDNGSGPVSAQRDDGNLEIVHSLQCEILYKSEGMADSLRAHYPRFIRDTDILCANFRGNNPCEKHTRGPLFRDESGRRFLIGFVSKDSSCRRTAAAFSLPGFYTSVADHIDFINSIIYP